MDKDLAIIKTFLTKMVSQDNRCTAFPFFYVIRTQVEDSAPLENCDFTRWYYIDSSYDSLDELKKQLKEWDYKEEDIKKALREASEYGIRHRWEERGMFLTEEDAVNHLKMNHYHYSHNAHTYVKHAWRAPYLNEFLGALIKHFEISPAPQEHKDGE